MVADPDMVDIVSGERQSKSVGIELRSGRLTSMKVRTWQGVKLYGALKPACSTNGGAFVTCVPGWRSWQVSIEDVQEKHTVIA